MHGRPAAPRRVTAPVPAKWTANNPPEAPAPALRSSEETDGARAETCSGSAARAQAPELPLPGLGEPARAGEATKCGR